MNTYNIDKSVSFDYPEDASYSQIYYEASIAIFEDAILPLLLQYDNVSLIGEYYDEENYEKKYVLDIGYEYLALGFLIYGTTIQHIICKKDSVNDLSYIYNPNSSYYSTSVSINTDSKTATIDSHKLRIISKNNNLKVYLGCVSEGCYTCVGLDVDNFGNKYLIVDGQNIYYDKDNYINYIYDVSSDFNILYDESYVFKRQIPIYRDYTLYGISRDAVYICNYSLAGGGLKLIDVEDTKYRQIYNNIWYIDNE